MNTLNRLLMILALLGTTLVVTLLAAAPAEMLGLVAGPILGLQRLADRLLPAGRALIALIGLGVDLLLLLWLWLELRRSRQRTVQVRQTDSAAAEVTTQTLTERLQYSVDALPDVVAASARVRSYGRNVEVSIEAEIQPGVQVAHKADEIAAAVREMTESTLGLELRGKPRVRIRAIRLRAEPARTPIPARAETPVVSLPAPRPEEPEAVADPPTVERSL